MHYVGRPLYYVNRLLQYLCWQLQYVNQNHLSVGDCIISRLLHYIGKPLCYIRLCYVSWPLHNGLIMLYVIRLLQYVIKPLQVLVVGYSINC